MAFNTVTIDEDNLPKFCGHELFIHSSSDVQIKLLTSDGGFPGAGANLSSNGTLYLTPFRLCFIPHLPTQAFFSVSFPLSAIRSLQSTYKTTTISPRIYETYQDIDPTLLNTQGTGYNIIAASNFHKSANPFASPYNRISFSMLPLHNHDVTLLKSYNDFFTTANRPLPHLEGYMPTQHLRSKCDVTILLPIHSMCTIHNEVNPIIPINDVDIKSSTKLAEKNKHITCYHQDFLFSLLRSYDFIHYLIQKTHPEHVPEQFLVNIHQYVPKLISTYNFQDSLQKYPMITIPTKPVHDKSAISPGYQLLDDSHDEAPPPQYSSINQLNSDDLYSPLIPMDAHGSINSPQNTQYGGYNYGNYTPLQHQSLQPQQQLYYQPPSFQSSTISHQSTFSQVPEQHLPQKTPKQPLTNPYSPLLLAIHLSMHLAQPIELSGLIAHIAKIQPQHMYSEWGSMLPLD